MEKIIEVKEIDFAYKNKKILNNISFTIEKGDFVTLCGRNGSGKSTLIKILLGFLPSSGRVFIGGTKLQEKSKKMLRQKIGVLFENPDFNIIGQTVRDDLMISLKNSNVDKKMWNDMIEKIAKEVKIESLLQMNTSHLSGGQKQLVAFAARLICEPQILVLDEAFTMIDSVTKEKMLKKMKQLQKKNKLTILQVTHDSEDIVYGNKILLLDQGEIVADGLIEEFLQNEKLFHRAGLELPFMANLSLKLKYYGLVDHLILNMDKMVDELWK